MILCITSVSPFCQNIVPNPSFETYTDCPNGINDIGLAFPWINPTFGTSDFFHSCSSGNVSVPYNLFGYQLAHTGEGYAGGFLKVFAGTYREYIGVPLTEPLEAGYTYHINFWVNLGNTQCGIDQLGAYVSEDPPPFWGPNVLDADPQFEYNGGFLSDTTNWVLISGCFIADGGEEFLTIGNFSYDAETPTDPACIPGPDSYYYFDDVSLEKGDLPDVLDFDLGDPVLGCVAVEIGSNVSNVEYEWSTGSTDSSIVVTETGIYVLTVTSGCMRGVDSIAVTIHGLSDVEIGPDEVSICEGEEYTITLDPIENGYIWQDGSSESVYTITDSGLYGVTLDDGCNTSYDFVEVTVIPEPEQFSLGEDAYLCPGSQVEFDFDASLGNFLWQDGSTSSYQAITSPGIYSLTISNECGEAEDDIEVFALNLPVFNLGPDSIFFCDTDSYQITLDNSLGEFTWQDGSHNNQYTITTQGIYSVSVSNDCGIGIDTIQAYYSAEPQLELGNDTTLCSAQSILLDIGTNDGNILWQDSSTLSEFIVNQTGVYSVQVSNQCGVDQDTIQIFFETPIGVLDLGPDFNLCPGDHAVLSVADVNASIVWQDGSTADTFNVTSPGEYIVIATTECETVSDTILITGNGTPPEITLPDETGLCEANTVVIAADIGGVSYLWSDGSQNDTLVVTSPGTYSLTVSNACGTDSDSVTVVNLGSAPTITLGSDVSICEGEIVVLSPDLTNVTSWIWNDGSTDPQYTITTNENVFIEVSNLCGTSYDTIIATLLPAIPPFELGNDTSLCANNSFTINISATDVDIAWSDGSTESSFIIQEPGLYYATISNSCGESSDTIHVNASAAIPFLELGNEISFCPGENILLSPGIDSVNYLWSDGSTGESIEVVQAGVIYLTISNDCGNSSDTLSITESTEGPQVDLGPDISGCNGDEVTLMANISGVDFLWQDGSDLPSYTTSTSGIFILNVSNNCGADADTVLVDLDATVPQPDLGPDTLLCDGVKLTLHADDEGNIILWQDQSTLTQFEVVTAGVYSIKEENQCGFSIDTIIVTYQSPPPEFDLGPDTVLCPGHTIVLHAPVTSDMIVWQDHSNADSLIATAGTLYSLIISNSCGTAVDEILVSAENKIPEATLDDTYTLCPEEIVELNVTQAFEATYLWSTGSDQAVIQIKQPGEYVVTITGPCQNLTEEVSVVLGDDCIPRHIYIPNIFSPNGDGVNDVFEVSVHPELEITAIHGSVFDRWGNLIYESTGPSFSWDGNFKNLSMMPGVYVSRFEIVYLLNGVEYREVKAVDVSLVR